MAKKFGDYKISDDLESMVIADDSDASTTTVYSSAKVEELLQTKIDNAFETINKNLKSFPYTLNRIDGKISSIVYNVGVGLEIIKTFNYTDGKVSSIVLSGDTPIGISLTKQFNYTGDELTSITYL